MWRSKVLPIPYGGGQPDAWGPSEEQLRQAASYEFTAHVDDISLHNTTQSADANTSDLSDEDENYVADDDADQYCDFIDLVEATELSDAYHVMDHDDPFHASAAFTSDDLPHPLSSPRKRLRTHGHSP